jgi:hypothetical protein
MEVRVRRATDFFRGRSGGYLTHSSEFAYTGTKRYSRIPLPLLALALDFAENLTEGGDPNRIRTCVGIYIEAGNT